jgi:hypothetical protein
MAAATISNTGYLFKTLWPQDRVENQAYEDNPLLAMIPKSEEFYGENMVIATRYAHSAGRAGAIATAIANKNPHKGAKFTLTRGHDYAVFGVDHEAILASKKDKGALIKLLDTENESAMFALSRSLAVCLYGDASGARGQTASDPGTGTTITLSNINDVTNFEVGMDIVFAASKTGSLRAGGARTISAVDRDAGTIEVSAAIDAAVGSGDYIFCEGDAPNGSDAVLPTGLLGWLPTSAPAVGGGDDHFGVDRSVDPVRLAGLRVDESAFTPEEGLALMLSRLGREGGKPSHVFRNPVDYKNIQVALGSKVTTEYMEVGQVGFTAIVVNGPKGKVRIISDQNCPAGRGFTLTMKVWKFHSLGKAPMVIEADDLKMLRGSTTDDFEGRMAYYGQTACTAPGWNANETLPS